MNIFTKTKMTKQAKLGITTCMLALMLAAGLVTVQSAYADESCKECAESVLDIGLPELTSETALLPVYDKENLFRTTLESFYSGRELFSINGLKIEEFDSDELKLDNTFASGEDLGGLDAEVSDYQSDSLEAGDILKAVPSISTKDEKTLGILVPPFAYFSKKF